MTFFNIFTLVANILNIIFIIFVLFFERKEAGRRFAWLLALVFLPVVGMVLYILCSGHFFTSTKKMERIRKYLFSLTSPFINEQKRFYLENKSSIKNESLTDFDNILTMNLINANANITFTESTEIYTSGHDMFEALCADLEKAKDFIYMQFFIFHNDKIGSRIMDILCRKAKEGVDVKLLYDDVGSILTPMFFFSKLDSAGGQSLPFFPVKIGAPLTLNFRNHRKNVIIDGKIGYLGGMNVGDEYIIGLRKKPEHPWRDTHLRLTGNCVLSMLEIFLIDWQSSAFGKKALKTTDKVAQYYPLEKFESINKQILHDLKNDIPGDNKIPTQVIASGPNDMYKSEIRDMMIRMIMDAKESIYLQSPYFTPDEAFISALKIAALSGKDIRIMVPGKWDKAYVKAAAMDFIREMIPYGIKFYAYPGFIHAKTLVVDGKIVTIGTTNIDTRSFELHFEMNIIFYDATFAQKNVDIFLEDQKKCTLIEKENLDKAPIFKRTLWGFFKLFSPLM